ncbi:MAG: LysM peptidoglycan-binding domain-containing protein [Pedosphaera sp.]|nr:LysM peptidoglycan-binding domain-containing protein [Pedosphaera sp.]
MNTPNPLMPQGSLPQPVKDKSTVKIAVFTIVAIHSVFFAGLLMQGCKRDEPPKSAGMKPGDTQAAPGEMPKPDLNYYPPVQSDPGASLTNLSNGVAPNPLANVNVPPANQTYVPPSQPPVDIPPATTAGEAREHSIARGDTLAKIAKANQVSIGELNTANPGLDPRKLKIGQKLKIPASTKAPSPSGGGIGFTEPGKHEPAAGAASVHQVKAGETLTKIAKQHGVSVKAMRSANGLKTDQLHVNQKLKIPAPAAAAAPKPDHTPAPLTPTNLSANPGGNTVVR